jgi:tetratricopeptide (TPR) repeat protein
VSDSGPIQEQGLKGALSLHLLGILHAYEGRYDEAEAAFLQVVEAEPEMAGSYVGLGLVYACRKEYSRMVEALRRALNVEAGGVRAYLGELPLGAVPPEHSPDRFRRVLEGTEDMRPCHRLSHVRPSGGARR